MAIDEDEMRRCARGDEGVGHIGKGGADHDTIAILHGPRACTVALFQLLDEITERVIAVVR